MFEYLLQYVYYVGEVLPPLPTLCALSLPWPPCPYPIQNCRSPSSSPQLPSLFVALTAVRLAVVAVVVLQSIQFMVRCRCGHWQDPVVIMVRFAVVQTVCCGGGHGCGCLGHGCVVSFTLVVVVTAVALVAAVVAIVVVVVTLIYFD